MDELKVLFKRLCISLIDGNTDIAYETHKSLFHFGDDCLPLIEAELLSRSWDKVKGAAEVGLFTGLLSLANDVSEARTKLIANRLIEASCCSVIRTRMESITSFTLDHFDHHLIDGVDLFVLNELEKTKAIADTCRQWLAALPGQDLEGVHRIYIISSHSEEARGTYTPILCQIMVRWYVPLALRNPLSWFFLMSVEKTLYHEVGHHVHRHTYGQDPDQEREADAYAARILRKTHPRVAWLARSIRKRRRADGAADV